VIVMIKVGAMGDCLRAHDRGDDRACVRERNSCVAVGNVCGARNHIRARATDTRMRVYDVGQSANVVVLSVTEGVDKPLKYPVMFRKADLVIITKIDLLPYLPGVSLAAITDNVARVMPAPQTIAVSATGGGGIETFVAWIDARRARPESVAGSDHRGKPIRNPSPSRRL
jgi:CobW/HypB/UreG, nucleotide-binding domain